VEEVRGSVVFHGAAVGTWPTDNDEVEDAWDVGNGTGFGG
jgi:hypothetical protein